MNLDSGTERQKPEFLMTRWSYYTALDILPLDIFLGEREINFYFKSKRVEHYQNFSLYIHIAWLLKTGTNYFYNLKTLSFYKEV